MATSKTMSAVVRPRYGPPREVLSVAQVDIPTPKKNEVLVKVHAASVNAADGHLIRGTPYLVRLMFGIRPRTPVVGLDCAGTVVAVGPAVQNFSLGDQVFGFNLGSFAEYSAIPDAQLAVKPEAVSYQSAAAVTTAAQTALVAVEQQANVQPGQAVLVNGAAGGVGSFAVQMAKYKGAHVTAVCSAASAPRVRELQPDKLVEYDTEDFTKTSDQFDVIVDMVGNKPLKVVRKLLKPDGHYYSVGKAKIGDWIGFPVWIFQLLFASLRGRQKFKMVAAEPTPEDMQRLAQLLKDGKLRPFMDKKTYTLHDAIDAIAEPHVCGKRVIELVG